MKINYTSLVLFLILLASCTQQAPQNVQENQKVRNVEILKNGNASGVEATEINYGPATGFLAEPKKEGVYPAVVMIHEYWGLNDNIKEMARQLAAQGYVVLAADLYNGKVAKDANEAGQLMTPLNKNPDEAIKNMKAAVQFLRNQKNVNRDLIASMGWCFGGGMSMQLALNEKLAATVIYYGRLETNATKLSAIKWPVLGIFGDKDQVIPLDSVYKFQNALNEIGIENEIHVYKGVGHAFANPSGMNYAPEETKDAWEKTLDFLNRNLKLNAIEKQENNVTIKEDYCEKDSDCVPNACCHPSRLINKKYAPKCEIAACTLECSGPLDCRQWRPLCQNNTCMIIFE